MKHDRLNKKVVAFHLRFEMIPAFSRPMQTDADVLCPLTVSLTPPKAWAEVCQNKLITVKN